jgi:hypothetical protein
MIHQRQTTEQIINQLRQTNVELGKGQTIASACRLTSDDVLERLAWPMATGDTPRSIVAGQRVPCNRWY